ncbi:hypothetical protein BDA99DRAFT_552625 [Phascolomyces articulosus]|uniref:Amino acid transporter transmembrane domain-containing protein n=1 Tax=Phascolomyces articulosus TaxID=60185 RepID=A0AAD5PCW7_9FUNG|nr:hypothetical protein BDA99DRAFT_552625 [Phascolomyces articulosus]
MSGAKGIGSFGAVALLVSSMTGPGLSTIPPMFQQSGWLAPMFVFVAIAILSAFSALFIIEVLSSIRGNEKFQAKVEFTTVAQLILGKKYHYFFQIILFLALQAVNVASIILAAQTIDSMLLTIFNGTCGLGVSPGRWFCISERSVLGNSPFSPDDYYIFTFGYLLTAFMVMPLGFFSLVENIYVQMISFIVLCGVIIQWIVAFCQEGLETSRLPVSGPDSSLVLGIVIFNYSYITTIPTLVNDLKPTVSIHNTLTISVIISTIMYILLGVFGAMAYEMTSTSDILAILSSQGSTASLVTTYIFPICALVTSIPVFTIVIRTNLVRGNICNRPWAIFWSNILPWFVCIPLQTKSYVGMIQNWSSLFFQSTINFILPFILYFASRKYQASVVQNDNKPTATEKQKQIGASLPSPGIPSDKNEELDQEDPDDVVMHYPEENKSISIRRSGRTSRISRIEMATSPRSPYSGFRSPLSPKSFRSGNAHHVTTPVIVLDETVTPASRLQVSQQEPGSPNILKVPSLPPPSSASNNTTEQAPGSPSPRPSTATVGSGLGITPSPTATTTTTVVAANNKSTNEEKNEHHEDTIPESSSKKQDRITSWFSSNFSFRNNHSNNSGNGNAIAPVSANSNVISSPIIQLENNSNNNSNNNVVLYDDDDIKENASKVTVEEDNEVNHFMAFKPRPWLNPFYVAVVSSGLLGVAVIFMVIYDLTMLGLGNNVFG